MGKMLFDEILSKFIEVGRVSKDILEENLMLQSRFNWVLGL